ncbi:MAG: NTP transferase domain-containing protein [Butyricicoccus pullicaecorum]|nr:NTP transferase domain-containing protein [Butyricicoccus pullicaecorum]
MITAVVMAAGLSTRMGADKLSLLLAGKPVFVHVLSCVSDIPFAERLVVTNREQIARYAVQHGFRVVPSPDAALGMGYSVAAGARAVRADTQGIMFLNADQPFISREIIEKLYGLFRDKNQIIVPCVKEKPSSPCIFPIRFRQALAALTGEQGGRQVYRKHLDETCFVPQQSAELFADLDYPSDYLPYQ